MENKWSKTGFLDEKKQDDTDPQRIKGDNFRMIRLVPMYKESCRKGPTQRPEKPDAKIPPYQQGPRLAKEKPRMTTSKPNHLILSLSEHRWKCWGRRRCGRK